MTYELIVVITALLISLLVIPWMRRAAPYVGLMDRPDQRKVHRTPVARVGGWGIMAGLLVAIALWMPLDRVAAAYLVGVGLLFVSGTLDDRLELGHYAKFAAQFAAVAVFIYYGDVYVRQVPFLAAPLGPELGIPFTAFALVGVINALNHSDGLDGLAGGEAAASLIALCYLTYLAGSTTSGGIALAALGAILGFLRYNTHPASVFMGDSGSQVLGFTLGVLVILLTQTGEAGLSPAVVLPLLGLPVADILYVFWRRAREGKNWFRATRNHIHHRLLDRGLLHKESVTLIYSVHCLLVFTGVWLRHSSDWLLMTIYVAVSGSVFVALHSAEARNWRARPASNRVLKALGRAKRSRLAVIAPRRFLQIGIPVYLVTVSAVTMDVHPGLRLTAGALFILLLLSTAGIASRCSLTARAFIYMVCSLVVYSTIASPGMGPPWLRTAESVFFVLIVLSIAVALQSSPARRRAEFRTTAMDYLVVLILWMAVGMVLNPFAPLEAMAFKLAVLLYGCELLLVEYRDRWRELAIPSMAAAGLIALRGLL